MAKLTAEELIQAIDEMTVLELNELVKAFSSRTVISSIA